MPAKSTFTRPKLETRLWSVPVVPQVLQSSSEQEQRSKRARPTGRDTSEKDNPSPTKTGISHSDGRDLRPLQISNDDDCEQGRATSR